jgi:transcriptional antiterminator RfaH
MKHWYLIHTKIRQELRALSNLQSQGFNCFLPLIEAEKIKRSSLITVIEPLFPRYLFIQLETDIVGKSWSPIRSTLGVSQLVMFGNTPARLDENQMDLIQSHINNSKANRLHFEAGQAVVITEGAFFGLHAVYQMSSGESRVIILLQLMSKMVKMSLPPTFIRALN